jgi:hypothetical protein
MTFQAPGQSQITIAPFLEPADEYLLTRPVGKVGMVNVGLLGEAAERSGNALWLLRCCHGKALCRPFASCHPTRSMAPAIREQRLWPSHDRVRLPRVASST